MAAPNPAKFTIQGTPSANPTTGDRGYFADPDENLAITLEQNPASEVLSVTYFVFDANNPDGPQASRSAREWLPSKLVFVESDLTSITPDGKNDTVHIHIPPSSLPDGPATWAIDAIVSTPAGQFKYTRAITLANAGDELREILPAEKQEFYAKGWTETLALIARAVQQTGGGFVTSWSQYTRNDLDTENSDLVLGAGGSVLVAQRNVGSTRTMCFVITWGTTPSAGTGALLFPLSEDDDMTFDDAQSFDITGVAVGPQIATITNKAATLTSMPFMSVDLIHAAVADSEDIVSALGAPVEGAIWMVEFSLPVKPVEA